MLLDRHAEARQQFAGARLGGVAADTPRTLLQFGGVHVVVFARVRIGVDRVALLHRLPHLGVAHQHHVEHPLVLEGELVLAQLAHALALSIATDPALGSRSPPRIFMNVDLPQPLAPIRP